MYRAIVKKFVDDFSKSRKTFYKDSAERCADSCILIFKQRGIRAIISNRVKDEDSLLNKAKNKDSKKKYALIEDIYKDIKDLAGVRIALYFPDDYKEVEKIIKDLFDVENEKSFPQDTKVSLSKKYTKVFSGYKAKHYIVRHRKSSLPTKGKDLSSYRVEIQVATVLMHAWAEVEHDLIYKPSSGDISHEEHQILDEVNGLVLSGELAMARLQTVASQRLKELQPFDSKYDLHIFLKKYFLNNNPTVDSYNIGRIDYLFEFVKSIELNKPNEIIAYLKNISFEEEIADQIIGQIIDKNQGYKNKYIEAIENVKYNNQNKSVLYNKSFVDMITGWTELQQTISNHFANADNYKSIHKNLRNIQETYSNIIDSDLLKQVESIRKLRNQISHSLEQQPTLEMLNEANKTMKKVSEKIKNSLKFIP